MNPTRTEAFHKGYDAKVEEIQTIGWVAARDKFNGENIPGEKWCGTPEGLQYAQGEYQALCDEMPPLCLTTPWPPQAA